MGREYNLKSNTIKGKGRDLCLATGVERRFRAPQMGTRGEAERGGYWGQKKRGLGWLQVQEGKAGKLKFSDEEGRTR